jgi:hypothetical protein
MSVGCRYEKRTPHSVRPGMAFAITDPALASQLYLVCDHSSREHFNQVPCSRDAHQCAINTHPFPKLSSRRQDASRFIR